MQAFVDPAGGGGWGYRWAHAFFFFFFLRGKDDGVGGPQPGSPVHSLGQFAGPLGAVLGLAGVQGSEGFSVRALKGGQVFSPEPSSLGPVVLSNLGAAC